uniref:Polyprotein n=1 Tax=Solanum tuberosum TaxID=4113 RepID=M1DUZ2_SOLTU
MKECPKNMQGNGNRGNRAQSSLVSPLDGFTPRGATSGTGGGANRLYSITSRKEQGNYPYVVTEDIGIKGILSYDEIRVDKATWEAEDDTKKRYPHLFELGEIQDHGYNSFLGIGKQDQQPALR